MCGIVGISAEHQVVAELYDGLSTLQHRGQDAAGIMTFDGRQFHSKRGDGYVRDVFRRGDVERLVGQLGLGHVRYPTAGSYDVRETQPFFVNAPHGLALVHNGNLTNTEKLRAELNRNNVRHLNTSSDSEILLNVFAEELWREKMRKTSPQKIFAAVSRTMKRIAGSYAVIIMIAGHGMLAFRDPLGLRPLCLARSRGAARSNFLVASESVTAAALDYDLIGDFAPGEAVFISEVGKLSRKQCQPTRWSPCIFEHVYLARPDAVIDKISVYKARLRSGEYLAQEIKKANLSIDVVVPVPDTSRSAALTVAQELGVKYREGLIKNRYVARTFIMPTQAKRNKSIRHKLIPIELELRNKNILLVDDSIVRGNTSRKIVEMVRSVGAKKVYMASASPALRHPCPYGVDMPSRGELLAHNLTTEQICKAINADALFYLPLKGLVGACRSGNSEIKKFCTACFDGKYPTKEVTPKYLADCERARAASRGVDDGQLTLL
jgi:amidophosphoribosyltransferase